MAKKRTITKTTTRKVAKTTARKTAQPTLKKRATAKATPKAAGGAATTNRFLQDLLVRGEAAPLGAKGKLTADATHVVTGRSANGTLTVKRVRFKAF